MRPRSPTEAAAVFLTGGAFALIGLGLVTAAFGWRVGIGLLALIIGLEMMADARRP